MRVSVQAEAFDLGTELAGFGSAGSTGAVVTFTGVVRDETGTLEALEIEHYAGMTTRAITEIAQKAQARWDLSDVLVIHRYGVLGVGAPIMMVATASAHRAAAFEAAEYLMDYLKSRAPFWKKEVRSEGAQWVAAKHADQDALDRW
ncbi:Molybdopterin synthase catalytic subunit [Aquimixticola soesokkakensis]|uniref:Molybdopterin synthase catalytic subunit n=1 Tax=Aquimixticola soesokkakensis TaxID=1519096 RepID=A0A1Y5TLQ1_9RHOB|nr:molybdenum cofactor biosynthesis protein MoaE [Aquimixticola soesokkakensis]SLN66962.1 Molybdopterin synthase catalytic subunit [Aquimixticola soesokkakensis]